MEPPSRRSKRLHNFCLPYLRWGQQKYLRCVKLPSNSSPPPSSSSPDQTTNRSVSNEKRKGGARNGEVVAEPRPWNLRTRRAACSEPGDESAKKIVDSVRRSEIGSKRGIVNDDKDACKVKFSVSLLKEEIEEDFTTFFGKKPPRRPKKRPKIVQKKLNTIFPGLWLDEEVTKESYNVPEAQDS